MVVYFGFGWMSVCVYVCVVFFFYCFGIFGIGGFVLQLDFDDWFFRTHVLDGNLLNIWTTISLDCVFALLTWFPPWLWHGYNPTAFFKSFLRAGESKHVRPPKPKFLIYANTIRVFFVVVWILLLKKIGFCLGFASSAKKFVCLGQSLFILLKANSEREKKRESILPRQMRLPRRE